MSGLQHLSDAFRSNPLAVLLRWPDFKFWNKADQFAPMRPRASRYLAGLAKGLAMPILT
jgi:hypothetical protein